MTWPLYIFAGGQSVRFGPEDKARAEVAGMPLVLHVAQTLESYAACVTVVGRRPGQYEDLGLRTIADLRPDLGPLGGLQAALLDADTEHVFVVGCDQAYPHPDWLRALSTPQASAVAYRDDVRWHPMFARYGRALLPEVEARLERGPRAMWRLLDAVGARALPLPPDWSSMYSVNTPGDLRRLPLPDVPHD